MHMGFFTAFFRPTKHKTFNFQPRYYDEVRDRQQKRFAQLEREKELEKKYGKEKAEHDLRGAFKARHSEISRIRNRSNVMLVIILAALIAMAYFLLYR